MKFIVNCSTLSGTGVTQVAVSFLKECININDHIYFVFLSPTVSRELRDIAFPANFKFYHFHSHPLYGIDGFLIRRQLRKLERVISPDCVFSVFGPAWWTPIAPHLSGYAYPHYVYQDSPFFRNISLFEKLRFFVYKKIHVRFLKRNGTYFVTETEDVSRRLRLLLRCKENVVFTVSNTYNNYFIEANECSDSKILPERDVEEFRFLSLCSFSPHKNLLILNKVVPIIQKELGINTVKFILTIDSKSFDESFNENVKRSLINLGRVDVKDCPQIYKECDALFLPTTLECFSANYPEAMIMKKPIVTSNLSFATSICGDGALYFDPYDETEIASALKRIVLNCDLRKDITAKAYRRLALFLSAEQRAHHYIDICERISEKGCN